MKALLAIKYVFSSCFVFLLAASVSFAGFEVVWLRVERLRFKLFNTFNKFHSDQPTTNIHLNFNTLTFTVATACSGVTGTPAGATAGAVHAMIDTFRVSNCTFAGFSWFCATPL